MTGALLTHLIESTAWAALTVMLLTAFRVRRPGMRHAAWLLAALKFALPSSIPTDIGVLLGRMNPPPVRLAWSHSTLIARVAHPPIAVHAAGAPPLETVLLCLWLVGVIVTLGVWLRRWPRTPSTSASASELAILQRLQAVTGVRRRVSLRHSQGRSAAAVLGIFHPAICISPRLSGNTVRPCHSIVEAGRAMPPCQGIAGELEPAEFESILMHELAHVRRWDNLWSAVAYAIGCVFWFYPPVAWINRQISAEAELACDLLVVKWGIPADSYASGILKVCRLEVALPVAGISGIGSNLGSRIDFILSNRIAQRGRIAGALAITALAAAMTIAPLALGFLSVAAPVPLSAQTPASAATAPQVPQPPAAVHVPKQPQARTRAAAAQVWCAYMSVWYPEGTVARQGMSDRMCVADADGGPSWELAETAGRPRAGEMMDFNTMYARESQDNSLCDPVQTISATECACRSGGVALGAIVLDTHRNRIVCDRWIANPQAQWRSAIPRKDYR